MRTRKYCCCVTILLLFLLMLDSRCVLGADDCGEGNHVFQTEIIDATDTEPGSITYICEKCGHTYSEEIAPYGHQFSVETVVADCESPGKKIYTCKKCGYTYEEETGDPLGHNYQLYSEMEPTMAREGERVFRCSRCGQEYREKIPAFEEPQSEEQSMPEEALEQPLPGDRRKISIPSENSLADSTIPAETDRITRKYDAVNMGDIMLGSLEIILLAAFLPSIFIYQKIIRWNKKRSDEYRKHHRRWKESV